MSNMKEQQNHYHARSRYKETGLRDYINLIKDISDVRKKGGLSLNVHLPFEIQHPDHYPQKEKGSRFIRFGEFVKQLYGVPIYWENSPELWYGQWSLKYGQIDWEAVPKNIELTLDTGHCILGALNIDEAVMRIKNVMYDFGEQIKHLHIHENDLVHDWHWPIGLVITESLLNNVIQERTYIFEEDQNITGESPLPPYEPIWQYYPNSNQK